MAFIRLSHRPRSFWLGVMAALVSLGLLAAWGGTWGRNAWHGTFPRYVGVHAGNLVVLSSVWRAADSGVRAWQSDGWMYDAMISTRRVRWRPEYLRIGNAYSGTPPFKTTLHAVSIPLWILALPPGLLAWRWLRRPENWRGPGTCAACAYNLAGLKSSVCPECGHTLRPADRASQGSDRTA